MSYDYLQQHCQDITLGKDMKMIVPTSTYVPGVSRTTLDYTADGDTLVIEIQI